MLPTATHDAAAAAPRHHHPPTPAAGGFPTALNSDPSISPSPLASFSLATLSPAQALHAVLPSTRPLSRPPTPGTTPPYPILTPSRLAHLSACPASARSQLATLNLPPSPSISKHTTPSRHTAHLYRPPCMHLSHFAQPILTTHTAQQRTHCPHHSHTLHHHTHCPSSHNQHTHALSHTHRHTRTHRAHTHTHDVGKPAIQTR